MHSIRRHSFSYQQSAGFSTLQVNVCRTVITGTMQLYYSVKCSGSQPLVPCTFSSCVMMSFPTFKDRPTQKMAF